MEDFRILGKEGDVINYEKFKIGAVNVTELEQKKIAIAEARARCLQIIKEQNDELEKLELAEKELEFELTVVERYNAELETEVEDVEPEGENIEELNTENSDEAPVEPELDANCDKLN